MEWFEPAWDSLTEEERYVLETFYTDEVKGSIHDICSHYSIERSSAYNKKNRALDKLTLQLYGCV